VESDKFARERSSTEKLRSILRAESAEDKTSGLTSVSLLLMGTRQNNVGGTPERDGETAINKVHATFIVLMYGNFEKYLFLTDSTGGRSSPFFTRISSRHPHLVSGQSFGYPDPHSMVFLNRDPEYVERAKIKKAVKRQIFTGSHIEQCFGSRRS
jgi:hypothetical protein